MNRKKQILFYIICGVALLCFRNWFAGGYSSAEELLKAYAETNHMGTLESVLLEEEQRDCTFILGKAEKGLVYLNAEKNVFHEYSLENTLMSTNELVYEKDGVAVDYIEYLHEWHGITDHMDIEKLICWTGNDSKTVRKIFLYPDKQGLFWEDISEREVIKGSESGHMWFPGGSRGWGSSVQHVYAVEGLDKNGESVYWYSEYGFTKDDFSKDGYNLTKKIFELVVDADE